MTSNTKVQYAAQAVLDVREILYYTQAQWGIAQRNAYFRELRAGSEQLASFLELGHLVAEDIREMTVRQHVVLYQYDSGENVVTILRVMHPRRFRGR